MEKKIDFAKEIASLEEIADKMESEGLSLDESIALYEEGMKKIKLLEAELDSANKRINEIIEVKA